MKILAIDFGLKHIGLAVNQGSLIEPLKHLKIDNLEQGINKIALLCQENKIEQIVIGLPEGRLKNTVIGFSKKLEKSTGLKVFFQPEDFTSKKAVQKMIEANKPLRKRKKEEHLVAACLILESYLDDNSEN